MPKNSGPLPTEVQRLHDTCLWLAEKLAQVQSGGIPPWWCDTCGHGIEHHADDADEAGPGICLFPVTMGAPYTLCKCSQFTHAG